MKTKRFFVLLVTLLVSVASAPADVPVLPPVTTAPKGETPPAPDNPQAELKTAIPYFIHLIQIGDYHAYLNAYIGPNVLALLTPKVRAFYEEVFRQFVLGPEGQAAMYFFERHMNDEVVRNPSGLVINIYETNPNGTQSFAGSFHKEPRGWVPYYSPKPSWKLIPIRIAMRS